MQVWKEILDFQDMFEREEISHSDAEIKLFQIVKIGSGASRVKNMHSKMWVEVISWFSKTAAW